MKIAFYPMGGNEWLGGTSYLRSLCSALRKTYQNKVQLSLLDFDHTLSNSSPLEREWDEVLKLPQLERWSFSWFLNGVVRRIFSDNISTAHFLKSRGINVIFGLTLSTRYGDLPTLSWIYDFQHLHFPEMFSPNERDQRNRVFTQTAKISTRIIVMSESVKKDFERFVPQYAQKVRVLKIASYISDTIYDTDPKSIVLYYHLPEMFFYLPNQFWKHKNHELVFQAVKQLKDKGTKVTLVCSGHYLDHRHPTYFAELWQKLSEWNIREQVIYLGLIPYDHMLQLMRQSICVLNPSLFEGFGLTVDEAKSLGKKTLLSDISAFREQNPPRAIFFNPCDCEELADRLNKIWQESIAGPDLDLEKKARENIQGRIRTLADSFMSVVREVTAT